MRRKCTMIPAFLLLAAVVQTAGGQSDQQVKNKYSNFDYAYSVELPEGVVGSRAPAPAPNHGFGVTAGSAYLWVDASYDALEWELLEVAADWHLDSLRERRFAEVRQIERQPSKLGSLPALRLLTHCRDKDGRPMAEELTLAIRQPKVKDQVGIVYTIGLRLPQSELPAKETALFDHFVRTFQLQPLP